MHRALFALITLMALGSIPGWSITWRDDVTEPTVTALANSAAYDAVGRLTRGGDVTSGVLISPRFVLTAAHINGSSGFTFNVGGIDYSSVNVTRNPGWTGDALDGFDLMLIELDADVTGVTPMAYYTGLLEVGETGTSVGFGEGGDGTNGTSGGRGTKRAATNVIDAATYGSLTAGNLLFYDFDDPGDLTESQLGSPAATATEGMLAPGDSGGGLIADIGGTDYVVGIHSFFINDGDGTNFNYGDIGASTRVSSHTSWIESVIIPEPGTLFPLLAGLGWLASRRRRSTP